MDKTKEQLVEENNILCEALKIAVSDFHRLSKHHSGDADDCISCPDYIGIASAWPSK